MIQAAGALLMLLGALMWHIAHGTNHVWPINNLWDDFLEVIQGKQAI